MRRKDLPVYWTVPELARAMNGGAKPVKWTVRKTRRWLLKEGALVKRGSKWVATVDSLQGTFPEVLDRMLSRADR